MGHPPTSYLTSNSALLAVPDFEQTDGAGGIFAGICTVCRTKLDPANKPDTLAINILSIIFYGRRHVCRADSGGFV